MASEMFDTEHESKRLDLLLEYRTRQQPAGNTNSSRIRPVPESCFGNNPPSHHDEQASHSTQDTSYYAGQSQRKKTGCEQVDSFDKSQWQPILKNLPGVYWQDNDPWYLADVWDKKAKKYYKRWERVPIIRPEEQERYDQSRNPNRDQNRDQSRYGVYKKRKRKDLSKDKGYVVWPDHVERAFEIACICIPPILGKKKVPVRQRDATNKPSGRNELLALKIFELTGERRDRKQISSHIQVIKKFLEHDGNTFLDAVKTDLAKVEAADLKSVTYDPVEGRLVVGDPAPIALPRTKKSSAIEQITYSTMTQSINFNIRLLHADRKATLHTCTTVQSEWGAQERHLDHNLMQQFPHLDQCLTDGLGNSCEVILFEASISPIEHRPPPGAKLAICFTIEFTSSQQQSHWRFRTTRYDDNGTFTGQRLTPEANKPKLEIEQTGPNHYRLLEAPLMSDWWVDIFTRVVDRRAKIEKEGRQKLQKLGHGPCECETCLWLRQEGQKSSLAEEEDIKRELQGMSFMQEVFGENGGERLGIYLWKFHLAQPGETPTTTWRRVPRTSTTQGQQNPPEPFSETTTTKSQYKPPASSLIFNSMLTPDQTYYTVSAENNNFAEISNGISAWDTKWQHEPPVVENAQHHFLGDEASAAITKRIQSDIDLDSTWNSPYVQLFSNPSSNPRPSSRFDDFGKSESVIDTADDDLSYQSTLEPDSQQSFADSAMICRPADSHFQDDSPEGMACQLDDFNFDSVTDPRLISDFNGGHIRIDITQPTGPLESASYTTKDETTLQVATEPLERDYGQQGQQVQETPVLHAPQPRRLISPLPMLSTSEQISTPQTTSQTSPTDDTTQDSVNLSIPSHHTHDLCADALVLSQLATQTSNMAYHLPINHSMAEKYSQHPEYIQPCLHVLPSHGEVPMSFEPEGSNNRDYGINLQTSIYELHSSLLASSHPHADAEINTNAEVEDHVIIDPELESSEDSTQDTQTTSETTDTALSLIPADDNSWACDIAIAQLEGWIEHANAMEEELAGATGESSGVLVEVPNVEALEQNEAMENEAEPFAEQGKVIGEVEDDYEAEIKEEDLDSDNEDEVREGFVLLGGSQKERWEELEDDEQSRG